ncbi:MAG: Uncharacterized protein FD187_1628 [bacterium]|nr:MAG: Uncharacterized protein FD187_1628 [bacterium]
MPQAEGDVAGDGKVRKQGVILEHHADAARLRRQRPAGRADALAGQADVAGARRVEAGDEAQHGGLAAAGGAQQTADLAFLQAEGDAVEHGFVGKTVTQIGHFQDGRHDSSVGFQMRVIIMNG